MVTHHGGGILATIQPPYSFNMYGDKTRKVANMQLLHESLIIDPEFNEVDWSCRYNYYTQANTRNGIL